MITVKLPPVQVVDSSECGQIICRFPRIVTFSFVSFAHFIKNFKDYGVASVLTQDVSTSVRTSYIGVAECGKDCVEIGSKSILRVSRLKTRTLTNVFGFSNYLLKIHLPLGKRVSVN